MNLLTKTTGLTKILGLISIISLVPAHAFANALEAIAGDMQPVNDAAPHGVPSANASEIVAGNNPPDGWRAMTAAGQLYRDASDSADKNTRIEFRNMEAYVLSKSTMTWSITQGSVSIRGKTWNEAGEGRSALPKFRNSGDGAVSVKLAHGRTLRFFPKTSRGSIESTDIAGVFTTVQARLIVDKSEKSDDRSSAKYVISMGGDYWKSVTARRVGDGVNSAKIGSGRYKYVTEEWQDFNFTTLTPDQLAANPPPMFDSTSTDTKTPAPKPKPKPVSTPTPVGAVATQTTTTVAKPDVVVTSLTYANGMFTAVVKNQGTAATPASAYIGVSYYVDNVKRTWGLVKTSLAAGASVTVSTYGGKYVIPAGTHTIAALADDLNLFSESNESNNRLSQSLTVAGTAAPTPAPVTAEPPAAAKSDVVVTSLSYANGTFTAVVKNQGTAATPATTYIGVAYYVDDVKRTWGLVNTSIAAGASITVKTNGGLFAISSGTHTIGALADDLDLIAESNESNNRLNQSLTVGTGTTTTPVTSTTQTTTTTVPTSNVVAATPTIQSILANMGPSDSKGHGIEDWPVSASAIVEYSLPPGYSAGIGWGALYRDYTDSQDTNTRVALKGLRVYLLDTSGHWTLVSSPADSKIPGDRWPEDFGGSPIGNATRVESDGSLAQKMAHGYCWHFFGQRVPVNGNIVGILSMVSARLVVDNPSLPDDRGTARYVFAMGGDWWRTVGAGYLPFNKDPALTNAAEMGWSKLKRITNDWQTVTFTNVPAA
ncbi:MAG: hypothetical protein FIA97_08025, partial [Methylococcaceae bacterium]|nr:hypothetical protein [Methylococcaceae bacterium]